MPVATIQQEMALEMTSSCNMSTVGRFQIFHELFCAHFLYTSLVILSSCWFLLCSNNV